TSLLATEDTSSPLRRRSEPEVLERLGRPPVEPGSPGLVAAAAREVALGDPGRRPMRRGREPRERVLSLVERGLRLVEAALLEQRAAEHEPCVADLVEHVLALADDREGVRSLLLGLLRRARSQVDLRQRRDRLGGVLLLAHIEG